MERSSLGQLLLVGVPGMEIGTQHKYGFNILIDRKQEDSPIRPETATALEQRIAKPPLEDLCDPVLHVGFPLAGLLSEPIKIVQAPRLTMVLYEVGGVFRQIYTDGRALPKEPNPTTRQRSTRWDTRTATDCASSNASAAAISATSTSR